MKFIVNEITPLRLLRFYNYTAGNFKNTPGHWKFCGGKEKSSKAQIKQEKYAKLQSLLYISNIHWIKNETNYFLSFNRHSWWRYFVVKKLFLSLFSLISYWFICFWTVTITIKSRNVTVKGSRGTLQRAFKHIDVDIQFINDNKQLKVDLWFGSRKTIAAIR